jgi:hypothetical protein
MRLGKLIVISLLGASLLGAALFGSTASAGKGKLLGFGKDSGFPMAFAKGTVSNPSKLLVRITGDPRSSVEVRWDTSCARKAKGKVRQGEYTVTGQKLKRIKKGFKRPSNCLVNVLAAYDAAATQGEVEIELYARGKKAFKGIKNP